MKNCPYCNDKLEVTDIDPLGYDILGCSDCDYSTDNRDPLDDMEFFI